MGYQLFLSFHTKKPWCECLSWIQVLLVQLVWIFSWLSFPQPQAEILEPFALALQLALLNFLIMNMPFVCLSIIAIWIIYTRVRGRQKTDGWRERSGFPRKKAPLSQLPGQIDVFIGRLKLQGSLAYWAEPLINKYSLFYICLCL